MRILFVNNICGFWGGVERVIADAARGLAERGHQCALAFARRERDSEMFCSLFDASFQCADLGRDGQGNGRFDDAVAAFRPDVVFLHKVDSPPACTGVRCVQLVHDHDMYCATGFKYYRFSGKVCTHRLGLRCWLDVGFLKRARGKLTGVAWSGVSRAALARAASYDLLLANSGYVREQLVRNGAAPDTVRLLHPVVAGTLPAFTPVPDAPHVLFVGQMIRGKGVDLLLRALSEVQSPFHADILGVGNAEKGIRSLCKSLGLEKRVAFHGWLDRETLGRKYESAKVCVVPSRWPEPFGLVGQEAMRHGRPVVAFDVGGIKDWLEHEQTGLLVPEQDVAGFACALDRILGDTAFAQELGANAYRRVQERFSFERFLDELEKYLAGT